MSILRPVRFLLALSSLLLAPRSLPAAEVTDLGQGLSYLRVHALADAGPGLPSALAAPTTAVIDLRRATADEASLAALRDGLAVRNPAAARMFILVGPDTPAAVADIVGHSSALTLGIAGSQPAPKVTVQVDAATDRRAYDALETGTPVAALISGKIEKERYDEASLVQDFKSGNVDASPPPAPDPTAAKPADAKAAATPPAPLVDRVLQRAVHLHRALLALRK